MGSMFFCFYASFHHLETAIFFSFLNAPKQILN